MTDRSLQGPTLFGHPTGLFTLFFAEMWERFSYYGMRALLLFYMIKGFLGYGDSDAYAVYGAYTALVYMTPFFGGMLADKLLGARRAVVLGGLLMAAGHALMGMREQWAFFGALGLLIAGNGFFKPNISSIVGSLYPEGSPKRDGGFTIFYMGINLGAAMSPLLCGYIGETYGWHKGFGLATVGMLIGIAVFVMPTLVTQVMIGLGALGASYLLCFEVPDNPFSIGVNIFVAVALVSAAIIACRALGGGGLPAEAGAPPDRERLKKPMFGALLNKEYGTYALTLIAVPVLALLVSGFSPMTEDHSAWTIISKDTIEDLGSGGAVAQIAAVALKEVSKPAGLILTVSGLIALIYLGLQTFRLGKVRRERMFVVLILTFFSMLFWSFFEQAGSSVNNFTDRNVDRVGTLEEVKQDQVGSELDLVLTQEQLGYPVAPLQGVREALEARIKTALEAAPPDADEIEFQLTPSELLPAAGGQRVLVDCYSWLWVDKKKTEAEKADLGRQRTVKLGRNQAEQGLGTNIFTLEKLTAARDRARDRAKATDKKTDLDLVTIRLPVQQGHVGMHLASYKKEIPASTFQSVNPIFILLFGLVFTALWGFMSARGIEPSTPLKFSLGLLQLGIGFGMFWYGAQQANERGMVGLIWLYVGYLFQTTGELCLSPVGLSMITKLSPARLVSTVMGTWFLATAFSQYLAAIISQFTGVTSEGGGGSVLPPPTETVNVYGDVFGKIAIAAMVSSACCFILIPILKRWMHEGVVVAEE